MPGSVSTQGAVIDASLTMIRGLGLTQTLTGQSPVPVPIIDGPPGGANIPQVFVSIAGEDPGIVTEGDEQWLYLGVQGREERYNLTGIVYAYVGGDDNLGQGGPDDAQAAARDQATTIMNAIETGYLADPSFLNENGNQPLVIWAMVAHVKLTQTTATDPAAAKGRWAQYDFILSVYNTLTTGVPG